MKVNVVVAGLALLSLVLPGVGRTQRENPHRGPDGCHYCHIAIPAPEDAAEERYFLVRDTIDETCKTCHAESGCALGVNKTAHPSNLALWDVRTGTGPHPQNLPLHDGKIVCTTCHHRTVQEDDSYRRVRLAEWRNGEPDLTGFCADCHNDR
ncbi:MAG TPA: hypothetical protein VIU29_10250 [Candidatus Deferrimicrobiaceae bacterium]